MTENFNILITETNNPDTVGIDRCTTLDMVKMINNEDKKVALAVEKVSEQIACAIDLAALKLAAGGRMLYFGAGTSGRLGIIDAGECPPTYGTSPDMVQGIIAGGPGAVFNAAEGNEDNEQEGIGAVRNLNVTEKDVVVGIAASGRTPYVIGVLKEGKAVNALTVGICNNPDTPMSKLADVTISPVTGPEVIQGSTRMKAGTAQKMVLNMISTGVMIKLGKVYRNLMVDMKSSNEKLYNRAARIVSDATGADFATSVQMLTKTGYDIKKAVTAILLNTDVDTAESILIKNNGYIYKAIKETE